MHNYGKDIIPRGTYFKTSHTVVELDVHIKWLFSSQIKAFLDLTPANYSAPLPYFSGSLNLILSYAKLINACSYLHICVCIY